MRAFLAVALIALMAGGAQAATSTACREARSLLKWTSEALYDIRDGKEANGQYIADAAVTVARFTTEDGWPENANGVLDEMAMLALAIEDAGGKASAGDAEGLLGYAAALAPIVTEKCGPEFVAYFPRPGVGDPRACEQVIKTLSAISRALPAIRGEDGGMLIFPVANESRQAAGQAQYTQWSAATVAALTAIESMAGPMSRGDTPRDAAAAERVTALAATVAAEAKSICVDQDEIPMLAEAGG